MEIEYRITAITPVGEFRSKVLSDTVEIIDRIKSVMKNPELNYVSLFLDNNTEIIITKNIALNSIFKVSYITNNNSNKKEN